MHARDDIAELIDAARRGAPDAIGRLFEAARGELLKLADRELPAEVRAKVGPSDVVQETAVDMNRDFARFTGATQEELFAWLRGILRHNLIDTVRHHRAATRRETAPESRGVDNERVGGLPVLGRTPAGSAIRAEEAASLSAALARLSPLDRRVLELRHWQGLSFVAMAPLLERSEEAVRKMWYRALGRLRTELSAAPDEARELTPTS